MLRVTMLCVCDTVCVTQLRVTTLRATMPCARQRCMCDNVVRMCVCVKDLRVTTLCVKELCLTMLCVKELCVTKLSVTKLCVREGGGGGRGGGGGGGGGQVQSGKH